MADPRLEKLASLIIEYSLELSAGQAIKIEAWDPAEAAVLPFYRAALGRGAHPYAFVTLEGLEELLVAEGSEAQLTHLTDIERREMERVDAIVTLWARSNTRSFSRADPLRHQRYLAARRQLSKIFWDRLEAGQARWCGTLIPTQAHAQDAALSLDEYERFVYGACHVLGDEDPVQHWQEVSELLHTRARELQGVRELRIVGSDTDLKIGVEGRTWQPADGKLNMPDGEIFTSPRETATEGSIRFTFPAIFMGREVEDVRLRFEAGRVTHAEASRGEEYLLALLDMDKGSRALGEFAFGMNYEIDRFTRDILFDEKIGGTVHLALGSSFKHLGGQNESGLHWDMICDLREQGEIFADGELIWKAGSFVREPERVAGHV